MKPTTKTQHPSLAPDGVAEIITEPAFARTKAPSYQYPGLTPFLTPFPFLPNNGASVVAVTDLDRDGKVDLILQTSDGSMEAWFMDGTKQRDRKSVNPAKLSPGWSIVGP